MVCFQRTSAHHLHDVWPTDTEKRGNLVRAELFVLFNKCDARASIESGEHSGDDSAHRALGWKRLDGGGQLVDIVLLDGGALQDRGSVHGSTPNCNNCNASRGGREASVQLRAGVGGRCPPGARPTRPLSALFFHPAPRDLEAGPAAGARGWVVKAVAANDELVVEDAGDEVEARLDVEVSAQ